MERTLRMTSTPKWAHKYEIKPDLWIYKPTQETIDLGTKIKDEVNNKWSIPFYYFHLQQGGHIAALRYHQENKFFAHLDIERFFNTINRSRLTRSLKLLFDYRKARDYTLASTVKHPSKSPIEYILPYGFVQSPILASLCLRCSTLGKKIDEILIVGMVRISVFMDDIVMSSNDETVLMQAKEKVKQAANKAGFKLNQYKEQCPSANITVFNINLTSTHLAIEKTRYKELKNNYQHSVNPMVSRGIATYVSTVNMRQCKALDL